MELIRRRIPEVYTNVAREARTWKRRKELDHSNLPPYEYLKLNADEIRYVVLLKGKEPDDIRVTIKHDSIHSSRKYEALSYVWGDHHKNRPIFVDGESVLLVTDNLWAALKQVRRRKEHVVLWVDAISIAQNNDEEKVKQLLNMRWIYPQAERVLCWLGDDTDGTASEAFDTLESWAKASTDPELLMQLVANARKKLATGPTGELEALAALFDRPYWRRAWCLQEVCVDGSKPPRLLCGRQVLCWKTLYMGFLTLAGSLENFESAHLMGPNVGYVLPMITICWLPSNELLMSKLITEAARREAGIQHDMIFSLLGLAERRGVKYPDPDYGKTIEETCLVYTRAIIAIDQHLGILCAIDPFREDDTVPTWCIKPGRWAMTVANDIGPLDERMDGKYLYCATKDMKPRIEEPDESIDPVLKLVGFPLDKIVQIFHLRSFSLETLDKAETWADEMRICGEFCSEHFRNDRYRDSREHVTTAFLRTLTCDEFWISAPRERHDHFLDRFYAAYEAQLDEQNESSKRMDKDRLRRYLQKNFCFNGGRWEDESPDPSNGDEFGAPIPRELMDRKACAELKRVIYEKVRKRKFVVTKQGYIGIAPPECAIGDTLCLFPGSTVPLLLRETKCEGHLKHLFVGDAYVHGVMYGEALQSRLGDDGSPELGVSESWTVFSII